MPNVVKLGGGSAKFEGTATASQVLSGATFYSNDKEIKTGTMTNRGTVTQALNAGGSYTIPKGYHSGSGKVTANSLASQTSANATASQILSGKTAWVNGSKITGNIATISSASYVKGNSSGTTHANASSLVYGAYSTKSLTDTSADTANYLYYAVPSNNFTGNIGYLRSPASAVASTLGITADKIASGNTICGVSGSVKAEVPLKYLGGTTSLKTDAYTLTVPSGYDVNKVAVCGNTWGSGVKATTTFTITKDTTNNTITVTPSNLGTNATFSFYYVPNCSSINNIIKLVSANEATNLTTSKSYTGSIVLYQHVGQRYWAMGRSGTTFYITSNCGFYSSLVMSEIIL